VIRILIVDDHPAVRAGLLAVLRTEPGLVPVASVGTAEEALAASGRWEPDVVLADYQLPGVSGAVLALELKQLDDAPRVVVYSAFAEPSVALAAALSGAEAVVDKNRSIETIFETVRTVVRGKSPLQPLTLPAVREAGHLVDPQDRAIFALAVAGETPENIAAVLQMDKRAVIRRIRALIEAVGPRRQGYPPVEAAG
jgi:DNA-binding NarL/FixJ family response regulator